MWKLRAARENDHEAVVQLWEAAGMGMTTEDEWHALTIGPYARVLLAEEDGKVVGAAVTAFDGWRAFLYHVAVDPGKRRRGIAKALIAEAEVLLRGKGARRMFALVNENNAPGLGLCGVVGYQPEGELVFVKELTT